MREKKNTTAVLRQYYGAARAISARGSFQTILQNEKNTIILKTNMLHLLELRAESNGANRFHSPKVVQKIFTIVCFFFRFFFRVMFSGRAGCCF
jgi:hypothetical protein